VILLETDASDIVLSDLVRDKRWLGGAARKAGFSTSRRGWSEIQLADTWAVAEVDGLRAELAVRGYRVYVTVKPGPI
jgi:hypothetical protein